MRATDAGNDSGLGSIGTGATSGPAGDGESTVATSASAGGEASDATVELGIRPEGTGS